MRTGGAPPEALPEELARVAALAVVAHQLGLRGVHLADFADGALSTVADRVLDEAVEAQTAMRR